MKRLPAIASAVAATGISVVLIGVAVVGFTPTEQQTIKQMKARMARIEATHATEVDALTAEVQVLQDSIDGIVGDLDVLMANQLTFASDVDILDAGLQSIVADDGPLAQIDRNLAMTQAIVFEAHPPIALTDITPLVACDGTTCTVDVEWRSDPPATGQVEWGTDASYGNTTGLEDELLAYHRQRIGTFPQDGATYHFRVVATIPEAPEVASADMSIAATS